MTRQTEDKTKAKKHSRLLRWVLFSALGCLLFLGLVWVGLQTRWAKDRLAAWIASATARTEAFQVTLEGLDGWLPFSIRLDRIAFSDAGGAWLQGRHLNVSLRPASLLAGILHVKWVRMAHLSVSRMPESDADPSEAEPVDKGQPSLSLPQVIIREIRIDRLDVAKEAAGRALSYRLEADAGTKDHGGALRVLLQDLNRPQDALRLSAGYDPRTRHIAADLHYRESKGGLVAGLMGLPEAGGIKLKLSVDGPVSGAGGRLQLDMDGYGRAGLDLGVSLKDAMFLTVDGQIAPGPRVMPGEARACLGDLNLNVHVQGALFPGRRVEIQNFVVSAPATVISGQGSADLEKGLFEMAGTMGPLNILPFLQGTGIHHEAMGPIHLSAKGPFTRPEIAAETLLGRVRFANAELNHIKLKLHGVFEEDFKGLQNIHVLAAIDRAVIPEIPGLAGPVQVDMSGASPDFVKWHVTRLNLTGPEMAVGLQEAWIDAATGDAAGRLMARVDRMSSLFPAKTEGADGRITLQGRAEGNIPARQVKMDLRMGLSHISGLPGPVEWAVGPEVTLQVRGVLKEGVLALKTAHTAGEAFDLDVDGRLVLENSTFDLGCGLLIKDLSRMSGFAALNVSGHVEARGRIMGALDDFKGHMDLSAEGLQVNDLKIKNLHARLEADNLPGKPSGLIRLKGVALQQPLQLEAGFAWSEQTFSLSRVRADLPGMELHADLVVGPGEEEYSGTAEGAIRSMGLLKDVLGLDVAGTGDFHMKAGKTAPGGAATLTADFRDLRYKDGGMARLGITARADAIWPIQGEVKVKGEEAVYEPVRIQEMKIAVRGGLDSARADLEVRGSVINDRVVSDSSDKPLFLLAVLSMAHKDLWQFRLERFETLYQELEARLVHPATMTFDGQQVVLDGLDLQAEKGPGHLRADGNLGRNTLDARVQIADLPIAWLAPFLHHELSGRISVECHVSGLLSDPQLHAEGRVQNWQIRRVEGRPPLLMEARVCADRRASRLEGDVTLYGLDEAPLTARVSLPARVSLRPFSLDLDRGGQIEGRVQGRLNLAALQGLPGLGRQIVSGGASVNMGAGGTLSDWTLDGGIRIENGRFENPDTGAILTQINGRLRGDGRAIRVEGLRAKDGGAGTLALSGLMTMEAPFALDADLSLEQATLLRKETLTSIASGKLDVTGHMERLDLKGEIILDRTELQIPRRLPADIAVISVSEVNLPLEMSKGKDDKPPQAPTSLFMDLSIGIPARFFVRGRGLDAEFKGGLKVRGPVDNPGIQGTLQVVRGTFEFLSRTFYITHGEIVFDGQTPAVPLLNVSAQVAAGQIEAQVRVSGPVDAFQIALTSQPPLPQDEIMANILFGQSVAKLNPFQAYQLAASISRLSGGGMPDIVGKTRGLLGMDRLSFSSGDEGGESESGPTVSAGKYISEDVYVGMEQELTDAKQDVVVEVEITPNLSVESKAGTRSGAGIGFNWRYDY